MAAGIAHEIRNPLASMSGSIQILRQELPLTEEQAMARSGGAVGNRGQEAAEAAVEMAAFVREHGGARDGASGRLGERRRRVSGAGPAGRRGGR